MHIHISNTIHCCIYKYAMLHIQIWSNMHRCQQVTDLGPSCPQLPIARHNSAKHHLFAIRPLCKDLYLYFFIYFFRCIHCVFLYQTPLVENFSFLPWLFCTDMYILIYFHKFVVYFALPIEKCSKKFTFVWICRILLEGKRFTFFIKTKRILLYLLDLLHSIDTLIEYNCGIGMFYTFAHKCPPFHMSLADKRLAVSM